MGGGTSVNFAAAAHQEIFASNTAGSAEGGADGGTHSLFSQEVRDVISANSQPVQSSNDRSWLAQKGLELFTFLETTARQLFRVKTGRQDELSSILDRVRKGLHNIDHGKVNLDATIALCNTVYNELKADYEKFGTGLEDIVKLATLMEQVKPGSASQIVKFIAPLQHEIDVKDIQPLNDVLQLNRATRIAEKTSIDQLRRATTLGRVDNARSAKVLEECATRYTNIQLHQSAAYAFLGAAQVTLEPQEKTRLLELATQAANKVSDPQNRAATLKNIQTESSKITAAEGSSSAEATATSASRTNTQVQAPVTHRQAAATSVAVPQRRAVMDDALSAAINPTTLPPDHWNTKTPPLYMEALLDLADLQLQIKKPPNAHKLKSTQDSLVESLSKLSASTIQTIWVQSNVPASPPINGQSYTKIEIESQVTAYTAKYQEQLQAKTAAKQAKRAAELRELGVHTATLRLMQGQTPRK